MGEPPSRPPTSAKRIAKPRATHALDWYLAALLAPLVARDDLVALAAYTGETRAWR